MDETRKTQLAELARGAELIFENAEQLYTEACILRAHGALSRALVLHQLSNEECAKIDMMGGVCASLVMGTPVDLAKLERAFGSHKAKNHANAYYSVTTDEERAAREGGDYAKCRAIFESQKDTLHRLFNGNKNRAMYVDFREGRFSAPNEVVTSDGIAEMHALNVYFLRTVHPYVEWMGKLRTDPTGFHGVMTAFAQRAKELHDQMPGDSFKALDAALKEVLAGTGPVMEKAIACWAPKSAEADSTGD